MLSPPLVTERTYDPTMIAESARLENLTTLRRSEIISRCTRRFLLSLSCSLKTSSAHDVWKAKRLKAVVFIALFLMIVKFFASSQERKKLQSIKNFLNWLFLKLWPRNTKVNFSDSFHADARAKNVSHV